jgi:DNA-binding transcriptional LysR family regulator
VDRLAAMETFVRVVEAGSFSRAAQQLNVGQSAVSKTVAQLEEKLGVRLLRRSTRNLSVTEAGQRFYDRALQAIQEADAAETDARGVAAGLSGKLRVSASVCFARIHILPKLPSFLAMHPKVELEILLDDRIIDVAKEGVDVALRTGSTTDLSLTTKRIARSRTRVMASTAYLDAHGTPESPEDLTNHAWIGRPRDGARHTVIFHRGQMDTAVQLRPRLRVSSTEGLREAVLSGVGIAIVSEWLFTPELVSGSVRSVLDDWLLPELQLSAVYSGRRPSARASAFVAFVETEMTAQAKTRGTERRLSVLRAATS